MYINLYMNAYRCIIPARSELCAYIYTFLRTYCVYTFILQRVKGMSDINTQNYISIWSYVGYTYVYVCTHTHAKSDTHFLI